MFSKYKPAVKVKTNTLYTTLNYNHMCLIFHIGPLQSGALMKIVSFGTFVLIAGHTYCFVTVNVIAFSVFSSCTSVILMHIRHMESRARRICKSFTAETFPSVDANRD